MSSTHNKCDFIEELEKSFPTKDKHHGHHYSKSHKYKPLKSIEWRYVTTSVKLVHQVIIPTEGIKPITIHQQVAITVRKKDKQLLIKGVRPVSKCTNHNYWSTAMMVK